MSSPRAITMTREQFAARVRGYAMIRNLSIEAASAAVASMRQMAADMDRGREATASALAAADGMRVALKRAESMTRPGVLRGISAAYDNYAASTTPAKSFDDWLATDARADEFLSPHFTPPE